MYYSVQISAFELDQNFGICMFFSCLLNIKK